MKGTKVWVAGWLVGLTLAGFVGMGMQAPGPGPMPGSQAPGSPAGGLPPGQPAAPAEKKPEKLCTLMVKPGLQSSPWKERDVALKMLSSELAPGFEQEYAKQSELLNKIDLRITPMDYRFEYTCARLSAHRDGFYKIDPFNYPPDLPDELLPKGNVQLSKEAMLAKAAAAFKERVIRETTIRGTFTVNGKKKVLVTTRQYGTQYIAEGDYIRPQIVDVIFPGGAFRSTEIIYGIIQMDSVNEGFILMKTGVYFASDAQNVNWQRVVCYLTEMATYQCQ